LRTLNNSLAADISEIPKIWQPIGRDFNEDFKRC
jgi:hypothetical protein